MEQTHLRDPDPEAAFRAAAEIMARTPDHVGTDRLAELAAFHYGLAGEIVPLASEVERTDALDLADGRRLIFKTSAQAGAAQSFAFQSAVLGGLREVPGVTLPHIVPTTEGERMFHDKGICGYLQTRLEGRPLHEAGQDPALIYRAGAALAHLDRALSRIHAPEACRPVIWNIGCWTRLEMLDTGPVAEDVAAAMGDFRARIAPRLGDLDWQITHNDPSPHNTFVTSGGAEFIDFGDGGWNPRLLDLAIAAGHMVADPAHPLGGAEPLIAGYGSILPLSDFECEMLVGLMRARQAALILVNAWRSRLFPEEAAYINKNVARATRGLAILSRLRPHEEAQAVRSALSRTKPGGGQEQPEGGAKP